MFSRLSALPLLLIVLVLLSACVAPPPPAGPTASTEALPVAEEIEDTRGTLRLPYPLLYGGQESLDPASPVEYAFTSVMLYDRLVRLDDNGALKPELATTWSANDDATQWTFSLRDDVTFHDGKPLTSADVAYTFAHILDPELQSPAASTLSLLAGTETSDDHTILFILNQGHADFPLLLTGRLVGIIPVDSGDTIGQTGIGTGPFKLESLNAEGTTVLSANDGYWKGKPGLAGVEMPGLADAQARVLALQSGQVDLLLDATSAQTELFAGDGNFVVLTFPSGRWATLIMRTDTPPFDDVRVRQAIRLAADRQQLIDLVVNGAGVVTCDTPVAPTDIYRLDGDCPQDIEGAKALLTEAGYPDGLDVTLYTSDGFGFLVPLAEVYQQQAAAAGINVTLEIAPPDSYWSEVWLVEPFIASFWAERPADEILNLNWRSTAPWNESHFKNATFDQMLDDARSTLDFDARREAYQAAQRLIAEEGGHLIPFHLNQSYVMSASLSGVPARSIFQIEWHTISKSE